MIEVDIYRQWMESTMFNAIITDIEVTWWKTIQWVAFGIVAFLLIMSVWCYFMTGGWNG